MQVHSKQQWSVITLVQVIEIQDTIIIANDIFYLFVTQKIYNTSWTKLAKRVPNKENFIKFK